MRSKGFAITAVVFSLILISLASLVVIVNQQIVQTSAQNDVSGDMKNDVATLNSIYNEYLLYQGLNITSNFPVEQLNPNLIFADIYSNLTSFSGLNQQESLTAQALQRYLNSTQYLFNLMLYNEAYKHPSAGFYDLVSEQLAHTQNILTDLSAQINNQASDFILYNIYLLIALIVLIAAFIVFIYFQIFRRTLKSVQRLQAEEKRLTTNNEELKTEISERTRQLRESERLATIGQVAGMVGHDVRNPLQAIVSELYLARQTVDEAPKSKEIADVSESISMIEEQVEYINKIVLDLQDYARPLKPEYTLVDLSDIIAKTLGTIQLPDNIKLNVSVEDKPKVETDTTYIKRSITNLVNNAIQAMPDGGILGITVNEYADKVVIAVSDTGKGIPQQSRDNLFKPFVTTKSKGQGLGLAVVKRLIEGLGGQVSFETQDGVGTQFIITLPAKRAQTHS
jgi:Signal transduction histidine kinase